MDSTHSITINENIALENITGFDSLDYIHSGIQIRFNDALVGINAFDQLRHIGRNLDIQFNDALLSIDAFDNVDTVFSDLLIRGNSNLLTLPEFGKLQYTKVLDLSNNEFLKDISGFNVWRSINELRILAIDSLRTIGGFNQLDSIYGDFIIQKALWVNTIAGFSELKYCGGAVDFSFFPKLTSFTALSSLNTIDSTLFLDDFNLITDLNNLSSLKNVHSIRIARVGFQGDCSLTGTELSDISGLRNLDYTKLESLGISCHPKLSICEYYPICKFIENNTEDKYSIGNNGVGCSSAEEILAACELVGTENIPHDSESVQIFPNPNNGIFSINYLNGVNPQRLEIYNYLGERCSFTSTNNEVVILQNAPNGAYLVQLYFEDYVITEKLLLID